MNESLCRGPYTSFAAAFLMAFVALSGTQAGCSGGDDDDATSANTNPVAEISAPGDGASFGAGDVVTLEGSGTDTEDGTLSDDALVWSSSIDGELGAGASLSTSSLSLGDHVIEFTVTDSEGATGSDSVTITVRDTKNPPTAEISSPQDGAVFAPGSEIPFSGSGQDDEDGALADDSLTWISSRDGKLGTGTTLTRDDLSEGTHIITLIARDRDNNEGTDFVTILVGSGNPIVTIDSPEEGAHFDAGETISFAGSAVDPEDGTLTGASLVWTSSADGELGTGTSFTKSNLSSGAHIITLTATDSEGIDTSESVTISVGNLQNTDPVPSIDTPANNAVFLQGEDVFFTGSATDAEDGILWGESLVWSSSLDGQIGTGDTVVRNDLSVGQHTIFLNATDSDGASAGVSIVVTIAPTGEDVLDAMQMAYYPFNGDATDLSPNENDGVVHGATLITDRFGDEEHAYHFNGESDYIEAAEPTGLDFGRGAFTVSAWVRTTSNTSTGTSRDDILSRGDSTVRGLALGLESNKPTLMVGSSVRRRATTSVNDGYWHLIVGVRNSGGEIFVYVDTVMEAGDNSLEDVTVPESLVIGRNAAKAQNYFEGDIDDVRFWDRVLIDTEIQALYVSSTHNALPMARISGPTDGTTVYPATEVTLEGRGQDVEDGDVADEGLVWTSSLDGGLGTGETLVTNTLSEGEHTITLTVTDSGGAQDSASILLSVDRSVNSSPTIRITAPDDNSVHAFNVPITFTAVGEDLEEGELSGETFSWTSSLDGQIGTGASITTTLVTEGVHIITVFGTDSDGANAVDVISLTVLADGVEPLEYGLVAYYPFDGDAEDVTVNGNDGTVHGALPAADRSSTPQSALFFDGADDYVEIPDASQVRMGENRFTMALWFFAVTSGDTSRELLMKGGDDPNKANYFIQFPMSTTGPVLKFGFEDKNGVDYYVDGSSADTSFKASAWNQVAFTKNGNNFAFYINGAQVATQEWSFNEAVGATSLVIGTGTGDNLHPSTHGSIDDIRVYDRALTPSEISSLFAM